MKVIVTAAVLLGLSAPAFAKNCITSPTSNFNLCATDWHGGNVYQYKRLPDTRYDTHHVAADGYIGQAGAPSQALIDGGSCVASSNQTHYVCAEDNGYIYQYRRAASGAFDKHHVAWDGYVDAHLEPGRALVQAGNCIAASNGAVYLCADDNQNPYAFQRTATGVFNKFHLAADGYVGIRNTPGG